MSLIFQRIFSFIFLTGLLCFISTHTAYCNDTETIAIAEEFDTTETDRKSKQGITDTVFYESAHINYDAENKMLRLTGDAKVKYQKMQLFADTILYQIDQNIFTASGMPQLVEGNDTTIGDFMIYNVKTRRGRVRYASTYVDGNHFHGSKIIKSEKNELYVDEGDFSSCALVDTPHYYFYGKQIKVVPNDKIIGKPVVLNIGDAPVAVLPFFIFPINRDRRSGILTPAWGGNPSSGGYVDNIGYYFAPNDYIDFTVRGKVSEFKDFVIEGSSRYKIKYLLHGGISARYALSSDFLKRNQLWGIEYHHNQDLTPDGLTKLSGSGRLVSQKNFYQEISEDNRDLREQELTANMSLSRQFPKINGSSNISWMRRHNLLGDSITEDLPSVSFTLASRPLISQDEDQDSAKWFNKIYYSYNARGLVRHHEYRNINEEYYYPGMTNSISVNSPQTVFKWFTVNPRFNARASTFYGYMDTSISYYDTLRDEVSYYLQGSEKDYMYPDYEEVSRDTVSYNNQGFPDSIRIVKIKETEVARYDTTRNKLITDAAWNASVDLSTTLYGIFPFKILNFTGLRHTLTPRISYSFIPEHNQDKRFFLNLNQSSGHKRQQTINLSLDNQFQGKAAKKVGEEEKPVEEKFSIMSVNLSTSYDFEGESHKWSNLLLNASTSYKMVRLSYNSSFWMYDENDALSFPIMNQMSLGVNVGTLSAKGSFWGGDLLVFDSLQPDDPVKYINSGNQSWDISLTPAYNFQLSRSYPTDMFEPKKTFNLSASARINFTPNWSISWSGRYNFNENQWTENSFNLYCDLECWDMRFQWRPEKLNPGFYFLINIKKLPELKWEKRS